ncbi:hypothetical protein MVEN_01620000 [Mycena venus]|uniref:P-loop containing nucleoside triphosphate hydrolase protein n=1 Tax=Mycena venus TaxID=2733690 RepID=A0A8H6XSK3_9AGAR|nr:hypothetical protein MVEN_01620000 [Mycena venus]
MSSGPLKQRTRTVPLEVIGLGFSRTGTESLKIALETLGYTQTNHGFTVLSQPAEMDMWIAAIKAKFYGEGKPFGREEWDALLGDCRAVTDMPHLLFAEELIATYPSAKIILNTRDADSWWRSYQSTVAQVLKPGPHKRFLAWLDPGGSAKAQYFSRLGFLVFFKTDVVTEELAKRRYAEYYDEVRRMVPKERLLECEVKEGWGPLCTFLRKEVPREPFPRVNSTVQFQQRIQVIRAAVLQRTAKKVLGPFLLVVSVTSALAICLKGGLEIPWVYE